MVSVGSGQESGVTGDIPVEVSNERLQLVEPVILERLNSGSEQRRAGGFWLRACLAGASVELESWIALVADASDHVIECAKAGPRFAAILPRFRKPHFLSQSLQDIFYVEVVSGCHFGKLSRQPDVCRARTTNDYARQLSNFDAWR